MAARGVGDGGAARMKRKAKVVEIGSVEPRREAYQFLIVLAGTQPLVWRRILVPSTYTFWDLHVAIQDAMGWKDYHLHEFELVGLPGEPSLRVGLPADDIADDRRPLPGWETPIDSVFMGDRSVARYHYDFGDDWVHAVIHEGYVAPKSGRKLPACIAGAGACPPEDCGGPPGYERFLKIIANPRDREYREMLDWVGGSFDPAKFDAKKVKFDDPGERWRRAFQGK